MNQRLLTAYTLWTDTFPGKNRNDKIHFHTGLGPNGQANKEKLFDLPENFSGDCPCESHFKKSSTDALIAKMDSEVCERERAWRNYCKVRDSVEAGIH